MYRKCVCMAALCLTLALAGSAAAQLGQGKVLFEYWDNSGGGTSVDNDLRTNANFPNNPTSSEWRNNFQSQANRADNYGVRARAFLTAPQSGEYTFWVAGDDNCQLWLSTDDTAANATMIAQVAAWTGVAEWGKEAGQKSAPVALVAGQKYYIEALMKEGGGGDSLDVGWAGPGIGDATAVIAGQYCAAFVRDPEPLLKAQAPKPANKALDVTNPLLEWTAGLTAVSHDIYFGTTPELTAADFKISMPAAMYYHMDLLQPGMTYYWRVDEVDAAGAKITGDVWSFTVMPMEANTPNPPSGVANAPATLTLSWKAGQSAVSHDVYLGTDQAAVAAGTAAFLANVATTTYAAAGLLPATTYYWRVDEVDAAGVKIPSAVWTFTTTPVIEPVADPNLVGWWTFDTEPANSLTALDMSGNSRHGVLRGSGITFVNEPFIGQVVKLPGGDGKYIEVGAVGISGNDPTTIACWAKANSTSIPDWTLIFGFTGTADGQGGNGSHLSIDSLGGPGGVGAHAWGWEETMFSDQQALEWHHYTVTYDGTTIKYFGDGVEMDSDPAKSNVQNLAIRGDRVHIGKRRTQESSFPGLVDDCRVYNKVLSAEEIAALAYRPANIVWVSFHSADDKPTKGATDAGFTEAPDKGYTDLLKSAGYNVVRLVQTGTPNVALLNAADLVIVGRSVGSASFQNAAATTWNTVTAPMMSLNGYINRKSRMGFNTGSTIPDTTADIKLTVLDPTHPIFDGVALGADGTMVNPYAGVLKYADGVAARGVSIVTEAADDEATVLATVAAGTGGPAGAMVIAEYPAGATLVHDGGAGSDVLAAPRLVFLTGSREAASGKSSETAGMFDLYDDGAQMFLNAVNYMLNPPAAPPEPPAPAGASTLTNGGFEAGVLDPWGTYGTLTATVVTELAGAAVAEPVKEGTSCLYVDLPTAAANFWDAGLQPKPIAYEAGKKYTFSVWMKAKTADVQVNIKTELAADPWTSFGEQMVTVTTQWQEFSVTTAVFDQTVTPAGLTLHVGAAVGGFWVDGARLYEGDYAPAQ